MAINISYEPLGAVGNLALIAGMGKYRKDERELDQRQQQIDLQAQGMAAQEAARQQQLAAGLFGQQQQLVARDIGQQRAIAADFMQRAQGQAFAGQQMADQQAHQVAMQEAQFAAQAKQQALQQQYGIGWRQMENIHELEEKGFGYSPEQQRAIDRLDADLARVRLDDAAGPEHELQAEQQYWQQRARIRPTRPAPKPPQQELDESTVMARHPETGEMVLGTMGVRNGVKEFRPIKFPNEAAKAEADLRKAEAKQEKEQAAAELRQANAMRTQENAMFSGYTSLIKETHKIDDDVRADIAKLPSPQEAAEEGIQNYNREAEAQRRIAEAEATKQAMRRAFAIQHGRVAQLRAHDIAAEFGLQPIDPDSQPAAAQPMAPQQFAPIAPQLQPQHPGVAQTALDFALTPAGAADFQQHAGEFLQGPQQQPMPAQQPQRGIGLMGSFPTPQGQAGIFPTPHGEIVVVHPDGRQTVATDADLLAYVTFAGSQNPAADAQRYRQQVYEARDRDQPQEPMKPHAPDDLDSLPALPEGGSREEKAKAWASIRPNSYYKHSDGTVRYKGTN